MTGAENKKKENEVEIGWISLLIFHVLIFEFKHTMPSHEFCLRISMGVTETCLLTV